MGFTGEDSVVVIVELEVVLTTMGTPILTEGEEDEAPEETALLVGNTTELLAFTLSTSAWPG